VLVVGFAHLVTEQELAQVDGHYQRAVTDAFGPGATRLEGKIPVNAGGGLLAFGHPVGATGVKQTYELLRQMKRRCGGYQIPGDVRVGLAANMGGDDRTAVVTIWRNVG
jgi:acetyl-CoA acyltransferase